MKTTVSIIGLGLIGGSLGLALKRNPDIHIIGFDRSYATADEAFRRGIIDTVAPSAKSASEQADFVIFATPVNTTVALFEEALDWDFKENAIVSDTGSTKKPIMDAAKKLQDKGITFIGGHPMAGSHKSGVSAAMEHLFENAYYILSPFKHTEKNTISLLEKLLLTTKAKVVVLDATEHDRMTAIVSHFPHLIASSLVGRLSAQHDDHPFVRELAAGGFRDITRIASADPIMWRDITIQNRNELLVENDFDNIQTYFDKAKKFRDDLPIASQGALYMTYDLHVDVPDHPGVISEVTKILAIERISLTNIRIVETRTDVFGILVISFQTADDREKAKVALSEETDYSSHIV